MTFDASALAESRRTPTPSARAPGTSRWVGWIAFAAVIMIMLGAFHVIEGIVALAKDEYFVVAPSGVVLSVDYTTWGWAHVLGGLIVLVAGFCVLAGQIWARTVGVLVALLSAVMNLLFMAANPLWSLMMIALAVVIIMALTVHGSEVKSG